ncbi:MAG: hypothetical protein WD490_05480 [Opitutales bacterium]
MQQTKGTVLVQEILRKLAKSPAVAVLGARQVGKRTLSHQVALPLREINGIEL